MGRFGDTRAVEPLIAALKDESALVRVKAAASLGLLADPKAMEPLIEALQDVRPAVRRSAIQSLGRFHEARVVGPLSDLLQDSDNDVALSAAAQLVKIGGAGLDSVLALLNQQNPEAKRVAIRALGGSKEARACEALVSCVKEILKDSRKPPYPESDLPKEISDALLKVDAPAVEPVISTLQDKDPLLRRWGAELLGKMNDSRAAEPLLGLLRLESIDGGEEPVRDAAVMALASLGALAVNILIPALSDASPIVRREVAWGLAEIQDPRVEEALLLALHEDKLLIICGACKFYIERAAAPEETLIRALKLHGDEHTAGIFLNSGNDRLAAAGRQWAKDHGYMIQSLPRFGSAASRWGSKK